MQVGFKKADLRSFSLSAILLFILIMLFSSLKVSAPTTQSSCGTLSTDNTEYQLSQDVGSAGTCFTISAINVTLNCMGYEIRYANFSYGNGITITNVSDTVTNCSIRMFNSSGEPQTYGSNNGISVYGGADNVTIINNTIQTNGTSFNNGISLGSVGNSSIVNNIIFTSGTGSEGIKFIEGLNYNNVIGNTIITNGGIRNYGIYFGLGDYGVITNNTIQTNGTSDNYGIYIYGGSNETILNNTIQTNGTGGNFGIYLRGLSEPFVANNNTIINNIVTTSGSSGENYGLYLSGGSSYNIIFGNNISTNGTTTNYGIYLTTSANNNTVSNNTVRTGGSADSNYGIWLTVTANNNTVANNTVTTGGGGNSNYGIFLSNTALGNVVSGNNVTTSGTSLNYGIWLTVTANNNTVANNTVTTGGGGNSNYGIYLDTDVNGNVVFGNTVNTSGTSNNYGVYLLTNVDNNTFFKNTIITGNSGSHGLYVKQSNNNVFANNTFTVFGTGFGVQLESVGLSFSMNNTFYNNIFNTTNRAVNISDNRSVNNFSITPYSGTNIIGGSQIAGNFYTNSTSGEKYSYSNNCRDANEDGICDSSLMFGTSFDFYPLSSITQTEFPTFSNNGTNTTTPKKNDVLALSINVTDNGIVNFVTLQHNFTGTMMNSSIFVDTMQANVTFNITTNQSRSNQIAFKFYVNDSIGNVNSTVMQFLNIVNTPPVTSEVLINNSPIQTQNATVNASYYDIDEDTLATTGIRWLINGISVPEGDNQSVFDAGNYTIYATLLAQVRHWDGYNWSTWNDSNEVVIGDVSPPLIPVIDIQYSSMTNLAGNTNNFSVNATDERSKIFSIKFNMVYPDGFIISRSMSVPLNQFLSLLSSYKLFAHEETLSLIGTYNLSYIQSCDSSSNCNATTDSLSFPNWAGYSFTVSTATTVTNGGGGGGGGGGCDVGFTNVNGTCIPTSNITSNLTRAPRSGDGFCDGLAGEDPFNEPACTFKSSFLTCSDPTQPCFFKTQKPVAIAVGFIIGGGVLLLSVSKDGKGKDALRKAKDWLRKKRLWRG